MDRFLYEYHDPLSVEDVESLKGEVLVTSAKTLAVIYKNMRFGVIEEGEACTTEDMPVGHLWFNGDLRGGRFVSFRQLHHPPREHGESFFV